MIGTKDIYLDMQEQIAKEITDFEQGNIGVLDALTSLRSIKENLETGISYIKEFESQHTAEIEKEAREYEGKYNGYAIEVRQGRKIFDFSRIPEVKIAEANVKELKDYYKKAFEAHQKDILMADSDGVEIQLPELNYSKPSVVVKKLKD